MRATVAAATSLLLAPPPQLPHIPRSSSSRPNRRPPLSPICLSSSRYPGNTRRQPAIPIAPRCRCLPNPNSNRDGFQVRMSTPLSSSTATGTTNEEELKMSSPGVVGEDDLLIVGPGVLGRIIAQKWKEAHPNCQVFGQTFTTDHHDELIKVGINPSLRGKKISEFPYVVFCAPPSRTTDYAADIRLAASNWSSEGSFLFTSSSAVYDCNDNGLCNEDSSIVPVGRSPRTDVLLKAEHEVVEAGGCVLRLAGLYTFDRGAHSYWLLKGSVEARPDHILNLIHYEDAASLAIAILKKKLRAQIFLGCDNLPLSRQEIMDAADKSGKFSKKFQGFTGTNDPLGKRLNNSKTRAAIGWEPKYPSFPQFLGLEV